eukprot:3717595-Pleurochrysis_carterae.AAC.1
MLKFLTVPPKTAIPVAAKRVATPTAATSELEKEAFSKTPSVSSKVVAGRENVKTEHKTKMIAAAPTKKSSKLSPNKPAKAAVKHNNKAVKGVSPRRSCARQSRISAERELRKEEYDEFLDAETSESDESYEEGDVDDSDEEEASDDENSGAESDDVAERRSLERILKERVDNEGRVEYRVAWRGEHDMDSWERLKTFMKLRGADAAVKRWEQRKAAKAAKAAAERTGECKEEAHPEKRPVLKEIAATDAQAGRFDAVQTKAKKSASPDSPAPAPFSRGAEGCEEEVDGVVNRLEATEEEKEEKSEATGEEHIEGEGESESDGEDSGEDDGDVYEAEEIRARRVVDDENGKRREEFLVRARPRPPPLRFHVISIACTMPGKFAGEATAWTTTRGSRARTSWTSSCSTTSSRGARRARAPSGPSRR